MKPLFLVIAALLATTPAWATVVRPASLQELAESSAVIVHAAVGEVNDRLAQGQGDAIRTKIVFEILEAIKGFKKSSGVLTLVLPGGRLGDNVLLIPGMPTFQPGQEVVLLLEATATGFTPAGLKQGVFYVDRRASPAVVRRDSEGMVFWGAKKPEGPARLDDLLAILRQEVQP